MKFLNFYRDTTFNMMVKMKENAELKEEQNLSFCKHKPGFLMSNLDLLILAYATVRFWSVSVMTYFNYQAFPLWKVDYYARWVYNFRSRFDPFHPLMFWLWTVLIFILYRSLKGLPQQTFTFDLFYQTMVCCRQAYEHCLYGPDRLEKIVSNQKKKLLQRGQKSFLFWLVFGDGKRSVLVRKTASLYIWATLEGVNKRRFCRLRQGQIDCMPNLSVYWRCQVARWAIFIDGVLFYALIIASLIVFSFCSLFLVAGRNLPLPFGLVMVHVLLENLLVLVNVLRLIRCLSILIVITPVVAFIFPQHLRKVHLEIRRKFNAGKSSTVQLCQFLLREQHLLTKVLCTTNTQFFRNVTLALMAVLLPNNIYFVGYFFYQDYDPVYQTFMIAAIIFTSLAGVCSVLPATTTECLIAPVRFIPKIQIKLKGYQNKVLKVKLDELMASLCSGTGTGLAFTIGPLANITVASIYEFLGFYTGYLLFAFGNFM